jgi:hypothetical protein
MHNYFDVLIVNHTILINFTSIPIENNSIVPNSKKRL